jgi:hypothetical protein
LFRVGAAQGIGLLNEVKGLDVLVLKAIRVRVERGKRYGEEQDKQPFHNRENSGDEGAWQCGVTRTETRGGLKTGTGLR